jgi:micrococcal nuclease
MLWLATTAYLRRWRAMRLVTVIDGDTFVAVDRHGVKRRLRLARVDCPELGQRNGDVARDWVAQRTAKKWVQVRLVERDKYRRYVAHVRVDNEDLATALVREGLGFPLDKGVRLRVAALSAWVQRKGVHRGVGQPKPWHAPSRASWFGRWMATRRHRARRQHRPR